MTHAHKASAPVSLPPLPDHPLERLHDACTAAMTATNALILERLQSPVETIPEVAAYLINAGGKRIRPLLTLGCAALFGPANDSAHKLAAAVEFIHSATLLHDDVVDGSDLRRGKPTANLTFGNKPAVLVGDFLFSRAFELMVETNNLRVLELLSRAASVIVEGEVMQLATTGNLDLSMDDYLKTVSAKTAALFAAAAAAGPALHGAPKAVQDALFTYGHHLGIAFQIADDVLDFIGTTSAFGKQPGNDFAEGKITAPILFALHYAGETEKSFWRRTLVDHEIGAGDFDTAQHYLVQHDAFSKAHTLAETHQAQAVAALASLPAHPIKEILQDLAVYAARREK